MMRESSLNLVSHNSENPRLRSVAEQEGGKTKEEREGANQRAPS